MSNTELLKYLSAAQRNAAIQTGRNDLISAIKSGDDAHNCKNYTVEATDHRWVKEQLDDLNIKCKDADSQAAHLKNCGIIHNGHYINTAYKHNLDLEFDDMLYLDPCGHHGKPGYLPKSDFANQINSITNSNNHTQVSVPMCNNSNNSNTHAQFVRQTAEHARQTNSDTYSPEHGKYWRDVY